MKFHLRDSDYQLLLDLAIMPLKQRGARVFIFGSRASGNPHQFSDVDLLFELTNTSSLTDSDLSKIREDLEESNLTIKVDLVNFQHLAESYRDGVLKTRIEV